MSNPFAPKTEEEYQAKLGALASAITRMDPHVLAVQEVGDPVALDELADRVGGSWHIETAAPETGTAHTIRVGVLSRLPLTTFDPVAAFPDKLRAIQQGDKPTENTTAIGSPRRVCLPRRPDRRRTGRRRHQVSETLWRARAFANGLHVGAGADRQARCGVPQIVRCDRRIRSVGLLALLDRRLKHAGAVGRRRSYAASERSSRGSQSTRQPRHQAPSR